MRPQGARMAQNIFPRDALLMEHNWHRWIQIPTMSPLCHRLSVQAQYSCDAT